MKWRYTTQQGDTWDVLAHDIYGSEKCQSVLMEANPEHRDTLYFPAGVALIVPELPSTARANAIAPPWARG